MTPHLKDGDLALYASGDLSLWQRAKAAFHVRRCAFCRTRVQEFCDVRQALRESAAELPEGLDWTRLSAEMSANIHVGLAAGECVAPHFRRTKQSIPPVWRPIALASAVSLFLAVLMIGGWWLNMPAQDVKILSRAMHSLLHGRSTVLEDRGPVIEASSEGIELRKDGGSLGVSQDAAQLVTVSVSTQGSASAHYVDQDTGQVTITSVYAQ